VREITDQAYIKELLQAIDSNLIVEDTLGGMWFWADGKIRYAGAELEGMSREDNGYWCDSFLEGCKMLKEMGHIDNLPLTDS